MDLNAHPGQKGRKKHAHQLQTALAHADRAEHEERGFRACRWPDHKYDSQHGKKRENTSAWTHFNSSCLSGKSESGGL